MSATTTTIVAAMAVLICVCSTLPWVVSGHSHKSVTVPRVRFLTEAAGVAGRSTSSAVTLLASPSVVAQSGDVVTIKWSTNEPHETDSIMLFAGGLGIGWFNVSSVRGWSDGSGSVSFAAINMRTNYTFQFFSNGDTPVATSNTVTFGNPNEPMQLHLSLTNGGRTAGEARVMWTTSQNSSDAQVQWGLHANDLSRTAAPQNVTTYHVSEMCTAPANASYAFLQPGLFYDAVMTGLSSATRYYYRVGSPSAGWSNVRSFVSAPVVAADTETHMFAFGDLGTVLPWQTEQEQQPPSGQTVHWLQRDLAALGDTPSAVLHIGDISYARGWGFLWESFMNLIQPVASSVPWMVGIGNHEYDHPGQPFDPSWADYGDDSGGECGVPYSRRFNMDGPDASHRNDWYSFEWGAIHVTVLSTEHDFLEGSPQWKWAEGDLAGVDRSRTPWLIITGHRPMYTSSAGYNIGIGRNEGHIQDHLRDAYEPLMVKYGVDLGVWGHVHVYERTCGVTNFTCAEHDSDAPVHVTVGCAGNVAQSEWAANLPESPSVANAMHHVQPKWSVYRSGEFGYSRIVANATAFRLEYIGDQRGEIHDTLHLTKA